MLLSLGVSLIVYMNLQPALRAFSSDRRLQILSWLRNPVKLFPPQVDGDLIEDGVCGLLIARKLRVSQPTASEHLKVLVQAGVGGGKSIKQRAFYKSDEAQNKRRKSRIVEEI